MSEEKLVKVKTTKKNRFGGKVQFPWGITSFDKNGFAEIGESNLETYDISQYSLTSDAELKEVNQVKATANGEKKTATEVLEDVKKKAGTYSKPSEEELESLKVDGENTETTENADDESTTKDNGGSGENTEKADEELIKEMEKELHTKDIEELRTLAIELKVPRNRVKHMSKSGLVKILARKI